MSEPFGQWLKEQREDRGLTLRDVERITDGKLSNATLSMIETGRTENPSVMTLYRLSGALALDFSEICERAAVGCEPRPQPDFCPHCGRIMPPAT